MNTELNDRLEKEIHKNAVEKGFWKEKPSIEQMLMLVITELSEAVEAHREGRQADTESYIKAKAKDPNNTSLHFQQFIKDSVADELADAYIRLLDLKAGFNIPTIEPTEDGEQKLYDELKSLNFSEQIFSVVQSIAFAHISTYSNAIAITLSQIKIIAEINKIWLQYHITEKMNYNESRPQLHGKQY